MKCRDVSTGPEFGPKWAIRTPNTRTPHLRIGFVFDLEAGVGSFGAEAGGQRGFSDTAPRIILLFVRGRALEGGEKRTLQVHWS